MLLFCRAVPGCRAEIELRYVLFQLGFKQPAFKYLRDNKEQLEKDVAMIGLNIQPSDVVKPSSKSSRASNIKEFRITSGQESICKEVMALTVMALTAMATMTIQ